jgi:hypothetical protein
MTRKSTNRRSKMRKNTMFPYTFTWGVPLPDGTPGIFRSSVLPTPCQFCKALAIVALPEQIRAMQPDDTTHVCHPNAGGCNHGFSNLAAAVEVES